ncbi:MAG: hypothetical protein HEQ32_07180 [Vampirovibrio sp.]
MAVAPLDARKRIAPNTVIQAPLSVPTQPQPSSTQPSSLSPEIIDVVHSQKGKGIPWEAPKEYRFSKKTEATSQDYQNPNADETGVVRIDSNLSSSDVIELNDKEANPGKEDIAQQVQITAIGPLEKGTKSLKINLGDKDSLQSIEEASVKNIQVGKDKRLTLSFQQDSPYAQGKRDIEINFPEENLAKMTEGLNPEQKIQLGILLKKDENKTILQKVPKLLESLEKKSPAPKTMS